jgi:hypothetical protein
LAGYLERESNVVLVFLGWQGTVQHEFTPEGAKINKQGLACLWEAITLTCPEIWIVKVGMFLYYNASTHWSLLVL